MRTRCTFTSCRWCDITTAIARRSRRAYLRRGACHQSRPPLLPRPALDWDDMVVRRVAQTSQRATDARCWEHELRCFQPQHSAELGAVPHSGGSRPAAEYLLYPGSGRIRVRPDWCARDCHCNQTDPGHGGMRPASHYLPPCTARHQGPTGRALRTG